MRPSQVFFRSLLVLSAATAAPAPRVWAADVTGQEPAAFSDRADEAEKPPQRIVMRQLGPAARSTAIPSQQQVAAARPEIRRRFQDPLSHTESAAGARTAAETLLTAAVTESDRTLRWLMIEEARKLGEAAGQAGIVSRAIAAASAAYDFDAIATELHALRQIPLRGLDASRAAGVAAAAERVAIRAAVDGRNDKSVEAEMLAYRAWQRAGDVAAARRAAERHAAALAGKHPSAAAEQP